MEQKRELRRPAEQQDLAVTRRWMLSKTGTAAIALFGLRFLPVGNRSFNQPGCRDERDERPANSGDDGSDLQAACDRSDREEFLRWVGEHMLAGARQQMTGMDGTDWTDSQENAAGLETPDG